MQTFTLAGLCSGLTEAFVINPFEVVKVKLQAERGEFKGVRGLEKERRCRYCRPELTAASADPAKKEALGLNTTPASYIEVRLCQDLHSPHMSWSTRCSFAPNKIVAVCRFVCRPSAAVSHDGLL